MALAFSIFGAVILSLIAYGVGRRRPATRLDLGDMDHVPAWGRERLPFSFVVDDTLIGDERLLRLLREAIVWWREVRPNLFAEPGSLGNQTVPIMPISSHAGGFGATECCNALAMTSLFYRDGKIISSGIYIDELLFQEVSDEIALRALCHEFGHLLRFDHDDIKKSVMYPQAIAGHYTVTALDRQLLDELYA